MHGIFAAPDIEAMNDVSSAATSLDVAQGLGMTSLFRSFPDLRHKSRYRRCTSRHRDANPGAGCVGQVATVPRLRRSRTREGPDVPAKPSEVTAQLQLARASLVTFREYRLGN